jgi:ppGpp synthetase/RelA/SpoT-type nucleotidyltranferase
MATRRVESPPAPVPFTKSEVNRAGELLLDLGERMRRDGADRAVAESDEDELDRAWEALTGWRSLHARPLSTVAANLRYHVDQAEGRLGGRVAVAQRLKRLPTMIGKLSREQGRVTQMHDIGGARAVVPSLQHVYAVRRRLLKSWTVIRERDYIDEPKASGYRALHVIVLRKGYAIEVQLRTISQDAWANVVEEVGRERGVGLKFGAGDADLHARFVRMSDLLARIDRGEMVPTREELRAELQAVMMGSTRGGRP